MKAALLREFRKDWELVDVPPPVISGPNDVIVRVGAAGFCRTDIHIWQGEGAGIELPTICGHENAGWVEEIGPAVEHLTVGDPVLLHGMATCGYCGSCRAGDDSHCLNSVFPGLNAPGGFAEHLKTNARACVPLPDNVAPVDASPLACGGITAYRAVKKAQALAYPGSSSVVIGAGGLGHLGIQCLRALTETNIVVVDRSEEALAHARAWGADHTVIATDNGSHVQQVAELTSGGAQVVLDFVGEHGVQNDAVQMLAPHGTDFLVGYGGNLEVRILEQALVPETSFVGNILGTWSEMTELVAMVSRGAVTPMVSAQPLEGVNDILHAMNDGRLLGRGVLVPNER